MDHERFALLLSRSVVAGLFMGVVALVQVAVGRGFVPSAVLLTTGMIPPVLVVIFFLRVVFFDLSDRQGLTLGMAVVIVVVAAMEVIVPMAALGGAGPRAVIDPIPFFVKFAFALLVALVVAAYVSHRLNEIYGLLAVLVLFTAPPLLALSLLGAVPMAAVFYGTSALFCVFLWGETAKRQWFVLSGLCLLFGACSVSWDSAAFAAAPVHTTLMDGLQSVARSVLVMPARAAHLPSTWTLGPAAVCFLPWAFKGQWRKEKRVLLVVVGIIVALMLSAGALKIYGLLPIISLLAVLATFGIHNLYLNARRPSLLFAAVVLSLSWNAMIFWK